MMGQENHMADRVAFRNCTLPVSDQQEFSLLAKINLISCFYKLRVALPIQEDAQWGLSAVFRRDHNSE